MSDKDIINRNEHQKNIIYDSSPKDMHLFSFSHLKSRAKLTLSDYNFFNLNFCCKNNNSKLIKTKNISNIINNRKIRLIEGENNNSLKTLNINVPSSERLLDKKFQEEFLNDYENSFANFCGVNENQFIEIYANNKYLPILDEFGDLKISIKSIIELLKTYSFSLKMKIRRRVVKKYRIHKIFKTFKNKLNLKNKNICETNNIIQNNKIFDFEDRKNSIINLKENNNNNNIDFEINSNNQINDKLLNLKKKLKISIETNNNNTPLKEENYLYKNKLGKNNNKYLINYKGEGILSNTIPKPPLFNFNKQNNLPTPNNNIFNFSSNTIQNYCNSQNKNINQFLNKKRTNTPIFNNNNSNNITNNFNYNINLYNPIISPNIFSPCIDFLSPSSYYFSPSNISSPNLFSFSPFYNNNMHSDRFTFNNINRNSFFFGNNSPIIKNNNINSNSNYNIPIINNSDNNNNKAFNVQNNINKFKFQ